MIRKVVIPAAGLGTRLLPATKEQPKEMLPLFGRRSNGKFCLKPMLQLVFEELYKAGFREFCFIVGRGKRSIEDHFTVDEVFLNHLAAKGESVTRNELDAFYEKLKHSNILFVNQPVPRGFGDSVHRAKPFTGNAPFLVHAGDDLILSKDSDHFNDLVSIFENYKADATLFVERVKNPERYGVVVGRNVNKTILKVDDIIEKPSSPPSNIAAIGVYVFSKRIYRAIERTEPDRDNEVQLTNAIRRLIKEGKDVYALELTQDQRRVDIGTPRSYLMALKDTLS